MCRFDRNPWKIVPPWLAPHRGDVVPRVDTTVRMVRGSANQIFARKPDSAVNAGAVRSACA